jgi:hypothetical protein
MDDGHSGYKQKIPKKMLVHGLFPFLQVKVI